MSHIAVVGYPELSTEDQEWIERVRASHDPQAGRLPVHVTADLDPGLPAPPTFRSTVAFIRMMTGEVAGRVPLEPANRIAPVGACGDEHGRIAALFEAHHRRLYTLARRLSNNADEARDLVQETFLRVATATSRVPHGSSHEEAWLVRILVNLCRDRWRRSATRRSYVERHPPAVADTRNAETALVAQSVVWQALGQLPPRRRAIVVMHELEDRSPAEIARTLGVTAVTVRWHLSRGRRELAQIIRGAPET